MLAETERNLIILPSKNIEPGQSEPILVGSGQKVLKPALRLCC